ncbi:MAG: hypothetical protein RMM98_11670, partial [Acidobacteriota bacterium]|nr:hypothetical protein [Acidobacteriota bacterium]
MKHDSLKNRRNMMTCVWLVGLIFWLGAGGRWLAGFLSVPTQAATQQAALACWGSEELQPTRSIKTEHINLTGSLAVPTVYGGAAGLQQILGHHQARPTALASADFDEDGVPDVICGYEGPSGGLITLHRGNLESLWPRGQGSVAGGHGSPMARSGAQLWDAPPFLLEAQVFELGEAPDLLGPGDFDADGHQDVVAGARGSEFLYVLLG